MTELNPFNARCLKHDDAAAYLGLSRHAFDQEVEAERLPAPIYPDRRPKVWDRVELDDAIDRKRRPKSLAEKARGLRESAAHQMG